MATVYLATDLKHSRQVAIKLLRPELAQALGTGRFLQEIEIAGRLVHPNVLPLLDSGAADGLPWYVMPYVAGDTLRDRLDREKQLPIAAAIQIACDVAAALQYAHEQGIVHRDIKPENILLQGGAAIVADFGIARALTSSASAEQLTRTGVSIGTPAYMSPEQVGAERTIDGRSDVYSLGCVLYEMLAGQPPFPGPTAQAILSRHQLDPVPPIRTVRSTVPDALERVVLRALAKVAADRFTSAAEFADALRAAAADTRNPRPTRARMALWAGAALIVAGSGWLATSGRLGGGGPVSGADTTVYAIVALTDSGTLAASPDAEQLMRDALERWNGLTVLGPLEIRGALERAARGGALTAGDIGRAAALAGAGRVVRLELSRVGDSARMRAALFDTDNTAQAVADSSIRLASSLTGADRVMARLADALLLRHRSGAATGAAAATRSLPALQALLRGHHAIRTWDLAIADSAFNAAGRFDGNFAEASLWLALSRWWARRPASMWHSAAVHAVNADSQLGVRDRALAHAVAAVGRGDAVDDCGAFERLARNHANDFTAWYALATCLRRDSIVVRDARSPSGWRFRSSKRRALEAYRTALLLQPSMHRAVRTDETLRGVLVIRESQNLTGAALAPDTLRFRAYPAILHDTLAFIPYLSRDVSAGRAFTRPASAGEAIRRQRAVFRSVASAWATHFPGSADAIEALALSLEMQGSTASLDTLRRARALAVSDPERVRLAAAEVWLRLKFALPSDTTGIRTARVLADSVLRHGSTDASVASRLASLAVLAGHPARAAAALLGAEAEGPTDFRRTGDALVAYAALGGPADSADALEARLERAIAALPSAAAQVEARERYRERAAELAFPHHRLRWWTNGGPPNWQLTTALADFRRGDTAAVRAALGRLRADQEPLPHGTMTIDVLYPEAWLLAQLGDTSGAARWLDITLGALLATAPQTFEDPARAGTLVHAMALRAELAAALGDDEGARQWARAVATLWSDADAFLQPRLRLMRTISGHP